MQRPGPLALHHRHCVRRPVVSWHRAIEGDAAGSRNDRGSANPALAGRPGRLDARSGCQTDRVKIHAVSLETTRGCPAPNSGHDAAEWTKLQAVAKARYVQWFGRVLQVLKNMET